MHCKTCKHSYKLDSYKEEHSKGLIFCKMIKFIDESFDNIEVGRIHILDGDNGEGVANNVIDFVHEDFGCINYKDGNL